MVGDRERLQVEGITELAAYASLSFRGQDIPFDLKPLEVHLEACKLCRDDVSFFTDALQSEDDAQMEMLNEYFGERLV